MARVKRAVNAVKKRRKILKMAKGYFGQKSTNYRVAKQAVMKSLSYSYKGTQTEEARFPSPVDHPHQRGGPDERHQLFAPDGRPQKAGVDINRKDARRARSQRYAGICRAGGRCQAEACVKPNAMALVQGPFSLPKGGDGLQVLTSFQNETTRLFKA